MSGPLKTLKNPLWGTIAMGPIPNKGLRSLVRALKRYSRGLQRPCRGCCLLLKLIGTITRWPHERLKVIVVSRSLDGGGNRICEIFGKVVIREEGC